MSELPPGFEAAWRAFRDAYRAFKKEWDHSNPDQAEILNAFFDAYREEPEPPEDPADWWKQ